MTNVQAYSTIIVHAYVNLHFEKELKAIQMGRMNKNNYTERTTSFQSSRKRTSGNMSRITSSLMI